MLQDLGEERTWLLPNPSCSLPNPVSLQENFELNHETLYLAVKLVDHYLVEVVSMKDKLQLIGSTAVLIASKFEVTPGLGVVLRGWGCLGEFWDCEELTEGGASILVLLLPIPGAADLPLFHCAEVTGTLGFSPGGRWGGPGRRSAPGGPANPVGDPCGVRVRALSGSPPSRSSARRAWTTSSTSATMPTSGRSWLPWRRASSAPSTSTSTSPSPTASCGASPRWGRLSPPAAPPGGHQQHLEVEGGWQNPAVGF